MNRYFIELSYMGTNYSGFQVQRNAKTIQSEVEKALSIYFKETFELTGSSRTDAGVHARQNYFHFDTYREISDKLIYNINAILPPDIAIKAIYSVNSSAHCRFDAISRTYKYYVYKSKSPFMIDRAYYYPYTIDLEMLHKGAEIVKANIDFISFSKRNTQVKTFNCNVTDSYWASEAEYLVYTIQANRFLRGMVRGLVATMLKTARGSLSIEDFQEIFRRQNCVYADFSAPAQGLFLEQVEFAPELLKK